MTNEERAAHQAACERLLARICEGEKLRVLVGDSAAEPASEIVLTAGADRALRGILMRGLTLEIGDGPNDPDPQAPAPAMAVNASGGEVAGD